MARIPFNDFSGGLWVTGSRDKTPAGSFRRFQGIHPVRSGTIRSRDGSTLLHALASHSLARMAGVRFQGAGTVLYRAGASILTGLDGTRLVFAKMPPSLTTAVDETGKSDYLFVAGGGLLRKVDAAGAVTKWGIEAPVPGFTAVADAQESTQIDPLDSQATWTAASAAIADEATILQEGTNSMRMTVAAGTTGTVTKAIAIDLEADYPDNAYIKVWMRVDHPEWIDQILVQFDVAGGTFAADYYTYTILPSTTVKTVENPDKTAAVWRWQPIPRPGGQSPAPPGPPPPDGPQGYLGIGQWNLSTAAAPPTVNEWVQLKIAKVQFERRGASAATWANVTAARITLKTTGGQVIMYLDDLRVGGTSPLVGTYKYELTFLNSATGHRSNPTDNTVTVTGVDRQTVTLASFPPSTDAQVDRLEIWRSVGNQTVMFKLTDIPIADTSFTDDFADFADPNEASTNVMSSIELPYDNAPPANTYEWCYGPHNGAMWWLDSANPARILYSPTGRPESVKGFVLARNPDDEMQCLVGWNGSLYGVSQAHFYQILGSDPYTVREIEGVPGTINPHTIVVTPYGILYEAADGVRQFDGVSSRLIAFEAVGPLFRGQTKEGIAAFSGVVAAFARNEYFISDGTTTLALMAGSGLWRNVGVGATALLFEDDTEELIAAFGGSTYILEDEGAVSDNGTAITFTAEWHKRIGPSDQQPIIHYLLIEANTGGQVLTPTVIIDEVETALPPFITASRQTVDWRLDRPGRVVGLRLTGALLATVEVTDASLEVYAPTPMAAPT